jgi:hypothetical protein
MQNSPQRALRKNIYYRLYQVLTQIKYILAEIYQTNMRRSLSPSPSIF